MDGVPDTDHQQEISEQVNEARALLELVPRLVEENALLRAQADAAVKEAAELRAEIEPLRLEVQSWRAERDEMTEAVAKVMGDVVDVINGLPPKLRPANRPSPFARTNGTRGNHQPTLEATAK